MRIEFSIAANGLDNIIIFQWQAWVIKSKLEIKISLNEFLGGYYNLINNIINDMKKRHTFVKTKSEGESGKKVKTSRYNTMKKSIRDFLKYRFIFRWLSKRVQKVSKNFYKQIKLESLDLQLHLGAGDAQITAYIYGLAWQVIGQAMAKMSKTILTSGKNIKIKVEPDFTKTIWICSFNCILKLKISHIIFTAYKALLLIIKSRRTINIWMNIR